jgi:hypothetical protein
MGMKGAFLFGEGWSRLFHFCSAQKEEIFSSFAHKQLNSVRVPLRRATGKNTTVCAVSCAMQCMSCCELVSLMGMNRTMGVGRHTGVIPEAPGLEPCLLPTFFGRLLAERRDIVETVKHSTTAPRFSGRFTKSICKMWVKDRLGAVGSRHSVRNLRLLHTQESPH